MHYSALIIRFEDCKIFDIVRSDIDILLINMLMFDFV